MPDKYDITYTYVCQCFTEENGRLFWKHRPLEHFKNEIGYKIWNTRFAEKEAGSIQYFKDGARCCVDINTMPYYRHLVVWMLHYKYWPGQLDHKDRDTLNDSIENLREATQSQNNANQAIHKRNKSGYKGVCLCSQTGKWRATIQVYGKYMNLGRFDTPELAHEAYMEAARYHYGEFASDGH